MNTYPTFFCIAALCISLFAQSVNLSGTQAKNEAVDDSEYMCLEDLININITIASKVEEKIFDAPGIISVISQDELKRFGGTTLSAILKRVPSLNGATIYMTDRSVIASRGDQITSSSSHILLLINGRPIREIHEAGIKSEVLESFPVSIIDKIEVIRGPGSVLYGSQAFSGVINIVTKKPENNMVSLSGMLGESLKNNAMINLQYKNGDFGLVVAGRYADKGGWETRWNSPADIPGVTSGIVNNIDVAIHDYGPGVYAELDYKDLRLMGSYNQWSNRNFVALYEWLNTAGVIQGHATGRTEWKKIFGDLEYKHEFTEWYNTTMNITSTRSIFETMGFPFTLRDSYEILAELTNFFTPVDNCNIVVGGVGEFSTGLEKNSLGDTLDYNRGIFNKGHQGLTICGYVQADYQWDWCKVICGMQINKVRFTDSLDNVDNFSVDFNPRAGVILHPLEHITIKSLYSTAYRAPSLNELYMDYSVIAGKMTRRDDPHFTTWNHDYTIVPEKVYTYDLGANYQSEKVQFGLNGFHSSMKNLVSNDLDTSRYSIPTWDNVREAVIFGLEGEWKYYLTRSLFFEGSFLYQQSRDEKTSETNVTPLPNFSVKGGVSYQSKFGLTASVFNIFRQSVDPKYYDPLNKSTKDFNMVTLYCSYDMNKYFKFSSVNELSVTLTIDNLLDEEVWLPSWGQGVGYSIPYNQGRTIYGGFNVTL